MTVSAPLDTLTAARLALACLDLTSLNADDSRDTIASLCQRAQTPFGPVAAVCVWPRYVAQARAALPRGIKVAAVANFPAGALDAALAVADTRAIVEAGGDEVDVVLPYRALMQGQAAACSDLLVQVRTACGKGVGLKVIIESGELASADWIAQATRVALDAGADFVKTSTGKTPVSATPKAAQVMLRAIAAHVRGATAGFKASGGIRSVADAQGYLQMAASFLGDGALVPQRFRFGASGLLNDIEAVLSGTTGQANTSAY